MYNGISDGLIKWLIQGEPLFTDHCTVFIIKEAMGQFTVPHMCTFLLPQHEKQT